METLKLPTPPVNSHSLTCPRPRTVPPLTSTDYRLSPGTAGGAAPAPGLSCSRRHHGHLSPVAADGETEDETLSLTGEKESAEPLGLWPFL